MSSTYLPLNPHPSFSLQASIQSLRAQLQLSRAQQKRCQIQLSALQSMRSRISTSLEELSAGYKKDIKSLEQKVKRLENENKQLSKQNALYELEVKNFQKRLLEKDSIISTILAQEFFVPVRQIVHEKDRGIAHEKDRGIAHEKDRQTVHEKDREAVVVGKQTEEVGKQTGIIEEGQGSKKCIRLPQQNSLRIQQSQEKDNINIGNIYQQSFKNVRQHKYQPVRTQTKQMPSTPVNQPINSQPLGEQPTTELDKQSPLKGSTQIHEIDNELHKDTKADIQKAVHVLNLQTTANNKQQYLSNDQQTNYFTFNPKQAPSVIEQTPNLASNLQVNDFVQTQPILKHIPPPMKKGPTQAIKSVKKTVTKKSKIIPKYTPVSIYPNDDQIIQQQPLTKEHYNWAQLTSNYVEIQDKVLGGVELTTGYHQDLKDGEKYKNVEQKQQQQLQQVVIGFEGSKQPEYLIEEHREEYVIEEQREEYLQENAGTQIFISSQHENNLQKQDISHGSIARSKKSKRQKPRPVEHQAINFEEDIIPVTQTSKNPSQNFFQTLTTHPSHIPSNNQHLQPNQDDHQMHGLVDQSSIQQIDDHSMISNPIFPQDNDFDRFANQQNQRRKGSTDQQREAVNDAVIKPAPSKKMSKKKAKRQTVEVMDPSSFL